MSKATARQPQPSAAVEQTDDAFLDGRLQVLQPRKGYRAGIDGVLLAAAVQPEPGARVLDVGAGVGIVGLCLARRLPQVRITMVERDPGLAGLARQNVDRNGFGDRARIILADVTRPLADCPELAGAAGTCDHVLAYPPFLVEGRGTAAGDGVKAQANAMPEGALDQWVRLMATMARPDGHIGLIHRADALPEVLDALAGRFGGAAILPLHPRPGASASRILVRAVKGSRAPLQLLPGLALHGTGNDFRPEIAAVLRDGAPLQWGPRPQATP